MALLIRQLSSGTPSIVSLTSTSVRLDSYRLQLTGSFHPSARIKEVTAEMIPKPSISGSIASRSNSTMKMNQSGADWSSEGKEEAGSERGESDSEAFESGNFVAKGAFLLTPSYELSMEKASAICEKMNFKSAFSLTKTATGILFKFANPEDYQAVFKKGFHKVTGARFYKKVPISCRPQKTYTILAFEVPEDIPEEDIRYSLYKFASVLEVTRLPSEASKPPATVKIDSGVASPKPEKYIPQGQGAIEGSLSAATPPAIRITLASAEEANLLLQNGLDFYGATYFPTDTVTPTAAWRNEGRKINRFGRSTSDAPPSTFRVHDLLPVFDVNLFQKIPPPAIKTIRPKK